MEETNSLSQLFKLLKNVFLKMVSFKFEILLLLKSSTITLLPVIVLIAEVSSKEDLSI